MVQEAVSKVQVTEYDDTRAADSSRKNDVNSIDSINALPELKPS